MFGESKYKWFKQFLDLTNGIPSHDTFSRVIAQIEPEQFQKSFVTWIQSISKLSDQEIIGIDGKTLRGSYNTTKEKEKAAIHMVSAWATANHLVLGQVKVNEKSLCYYSHPRTVKIIIFKRLYHNY
jgi:predicted phosphoadenosine phosphosulfate sulfurtransferase